MQDPLETTPLETFKAWFHDALKNSPLREPQAMALATLSPTGEIHNRIVLLKQITTEGLIFFTNYHSSKGKDLDTNPQAEAVFYWDHLHKQARLGGSVEKTSREVSEAYWNTRARESQLSGFISRQSCPVESRAFMEEEVEKAKKHFKDRPIPCPPHWGGFLLRPTRIELWTGGGGRLHDRLSFRKEASGWTSIRLYP